MLLLFFSFLTAFKIASALLTEAPQETVDQSLQTAEVPAIEEPAIESYEAPPAEAMSLFTSPSG